MFSRRSFEAVELQKKKESIKMWQKPFLLWQIFGIKKIGKKGELGDTLTLLPVCFFVFYLSKGTVVYNHRSYCDLQLQVRVFKCPAVTRRHRTGTYINKDIS